MPDQRCPARSIGAGVVEVLAGGAREARVVGVFSRGCYVGGDGLIVAVGSIAAGPLHVVVDRGRGVVPVPGTRVRISPECIEFATGVIDLSVAAVWSPALPSVEQVRAVMLGLAGLPDSCPPDLEHVWSDVESAVVGGDLEAARRWLEGRGGGTTPSGDDLLAGLLLVDATAHRGIDAERRRVELAARARTTDLSRAFLHWAARGASIAPVHNVIDAAAVGPVERLRNAAATVRLIGSASGTSLLAGLASGARAAHWPAL